MKDLASASVIEQKEFLNSFDDILSDIDGVLWSLIKPYPGSAECMNYLKEIGKHVHFVTNNCMLTAENLHKKILKAGLNVEKEDIVLPTEAIISYLQGINFTKEIYVVGFPALKNELRNAGFYLAEEAPDKIEETISSLVKNLSDNENVGAVIIDYDINLTAIKLQKAITYLKRKDVLFLIGAQDMKVPIGSTVLIGPKYYQKAVEEISGRIPYGLAKPDINYNKYVVEKYKITDPSKVLFIGDSVTEDMAFATKCGYQKLLVLSGITKPEVLTNWPYDENYKPKYYIKSLEVLHGVISKTYKHML